jgi:hypothetical protein
MAIPSASEPIVGKLTVGGSSGILIDAGAGLATGKVAPKGSIWVRTDGSSSTTILYVNTDGDSTWLGVGAL